MKRQLLELATDVFSAGSAPGVVDLAQLPAKIGQLRLENDVFKWCAHHGGISERKAMSYLELPVSTRNENSRVRAFHRFCD